MKIPPKEVSHNFEQVFERIDRACSRSGRAPRSVKVVAVTKSFPIRAIHMALGHGVHRIGENRVYEAEAKQESLGQVDAISWHMVGHIQSRKSEDAARIFDVIHSVDRLKIARKLSDKAQELSKGIPVLLECNVSGEGSKYGWKLEDKDRWSRVVEEFEQVLALPSLEVSGLMTMAPWTQDEQVVRDTFRKLGQLQDFLEKRLPGYWQELSMGMSDDFEIAIEEGATLVRLGRAFFGPRGNG